MRLENWKIVYRPMSMVGIKIPLYACGNVYGNPKFKDGTDILTSKIKEYDEKNKTITTRNSVYQLGEPMQEGDEEG